MTRQRTQTNRTAGDSSREIAIVGMACIFPGAANLDAYWQNILNKVDAVTDPPPGAWDPALHYDPDSASNDRIYCKKGGFLAPLAQFDPLAYGIMPIGVDGGEPDQWLALKVAYDALQDAGYLERLAASPAERQRTGVILGKGTYLNRGNLNMVQHSLVVDQTLRVLQTLYPETGAADLAQIRDALKDALPPFNAETAPGLVPNITAGRIANRLDLMGPAYTVDAACASSLIAIETAVRELAHGGCDLALVGGVQVTTPIPILALFSQLGALSRREQIRPFDKGADGTILSEGIGMVVLKRRAEAEADGDRIYAVVKGVGASSDGRGASVLTPRLEGEVLALRRAFAMAGVDPQSVGLIEAHGTGTRVGDQVEVQALRQVFGERRGSLPTVALGTVKSMIGHTMPAAGIAGVIKTALALYHRVLPPTLHVDEPDPDLELERTPFYLNTDVRPWVHGDPSAPRRAGVNAFGFGGVNAHVILEEAPAAVNTANALPDHRPAWESELVIVASASRDALVEKVRNWIAFCRAHAGAALADLAYTITGEAGMGEAGDLPCRLAIVAESPPALLQKLEQALARLEKPQTRRIQDVRGIYFFAEPFAPQGKLAFLFPGEGAQYPHMLADLCLHFPEVRACFDRIDRLFVDHPRGVRPSDFIFPRPRFGGASADAPDSVLDEAGDRLWAIDGAIEAVITANMALVALLRRLGIRPDVCVGHSTGEYSALLAAGAVAVGEDEFVGRYLLDLNRRYTAVGADAQVPQAVMVAVGAGVGDLAPLLAAGAAAGGEVYIGMDNCPHQTVVLGEGAAMDALLAAAQAAGIICDVLPFDRGYHSPLFVPYSRLFQELYDALPLQTPATPIYSCVTAAPFPADVAGIRRLATGNWVSRVRFRETIEAMYGDGVRIFVEAGPRGNLSAFVGDILRGKPHLAIPANIRQRSGLAQLNHLLALLSAQGIRLNLDAYYRGRTRRRLDPQPAAAASRRGRALQLQTGWPYLTLPPDLAARLHEHSGQNPAQPSAAASSPATQPPISQSPAHGSSLPFTLEPLPMITNQAHGMISPPASAPALQPPAPRAQPTALVLPPSSRLAYSERTAVVQGHLQLMEQFLRTQEAVMRLFLNGEAPQMAEAYVLPPASLSQPAPVPPAPAAASGNPHANGNGLANGNSVVNGNGYAYAPVASTPAPPEAAPPPAPAPTDPARLKSVLLGLVSAKTGYPQEMLDLNANLEADLGIDSIKRVEILGAFNRETKLLDAKDIEQVSSLKTLGAMLDFFQAGSLKT